METRTEHVSVSGITKGHALKAKKWLRDRSLLSFYRAENKSLNAPITKYGAEWTRAAIISALEATK